MPGAQPCPYVAAAERAGRGRRSLEMHPLPPPLLQQLTPVTLFNSPQHPPRGVRTSPPPHRWEDTCREAPDSPRPGFPHGSSHPALPPPPCSASDCVARGQAADGTG